MKGLEALAVIATIRAMTRTDAAEWLRTLEDIRQLPETSERG